VKALRRGGGEMAAESVNHGEKELSRQLVAAQVEMLRRLGHARDIELLFAVR
jgi:hypothetical protein